MTTDSVVGFAQLRDELRPEGEGFGVQISDAWRQGRTAYGGITTGLAMASAHLRMPDLPPLRSMLVNFTGPVAGSPTFLPLCLRQGKSVTTVQVTVLAEGKVAAQIIFTFGGNRDSKLVVSGHSNPLERSPEDYELFTPKEFEQFVPRFVTNFDTRLVAGSRSVSSAKEGYVRVVTRHRDAESRRGIDSFVAIADVLPPAALCMAKTIAPVSSVTWMLNMLTDDPVTESGWWQMDARITTAENGYSSQQMKVWALDGTPVAEGMQSVALFF